ncbi:MAG: tetratricopeptide repeat protein [Caldilineales bacterium]|nr:tetratricopeptide repeat protein [Caldilineales bacterium]
MTENIEIRLLGGLQITIDGAPVTNFISSKAPALLAYLLVSRRQHQRVALAGLLWGELSDEAAANNLRQTLTNLRKVVGSHLIITREAVAFDLDQPYFLDVETFTDLLRLSKGQPYSQRIGMLQQALAFYEGEFLEGFYVRDAPDFEVWVLGQRLRLRELALQGWDTLTGLLINLGDYEGAVESSARLLALDPWREETHRQRMLTLAHCGRFSAALVQYKTCLHILRQEFDAEPAAATSALFERIRAAMSGPRHNLPAASTGFVGRKSEIGEVRALLASPETRLLTLLGPGGVGKTRLALEVAAACEVMFLNGVWFASLPPGQAADANQLALNLAQALDLPLTGSKSPQTQLYDFLHNKELLLVLDNLEDWLEVSPWLSQMLSQSPDLKILVTSRQRLDLHAERVYVLSGLSFPLDVAQNPGSFAAVQLFLRRARRVQDDYAADAAEIAAIARICRLLDGLPLGIELAASWVGAFRCAEIADQIERNLDFLTTTHRDTSPRQRSLRAIFDWTWIRLSDEEQQVFQQLAVFQGPFTFSAAAHVAGASAATLTALAGKSLTWRRGETFQLHEMMRQFALEKLVAAQSVERTEVLHADYYVRFLQSQKDRLLGSEQQQALGAIEQEFDNVGAAWRWLTAHQAVAGIAVAMDGMYHFTAIRSRFRQGADLFGAARTALLPIVQDDPFTRLTCARTMAREGRFLSFLSHFDEAQTLLIESLSILRDLNEPDETAFVLGHLGGTSRLQGDLEAAARYLQDCLVLRCETGNLHGQAVALLELAGVAFMSADYQTARVRCEEGLIVSETAGDQQTTAHLLTGLSLSNRELGQTDLAMHYGRRSLTMYGELGDRYGVMQASLTLGELSRRLGNNFEARQFCLRAVSVSQEIGDRSGEADGHYRLGQIAAGAGERDEALREFRQALEQAQEIGQTPLALDILIEIADLLAGRGENERACGILIFLHAQTQLIEPGRSRLYEMLSRMGGEIDAIPPNAGSSLTEIVTAALRD